MVPPTTALGVEATVKTMPDESVTGVAVGVVVGVVIGIVPGATTAPLLGTTIATTDVPGITREGPPSVVGVDMVAVKRNCSSTVACN